MNKRMFNDTPAQEEIGYFVLEKGKISPSITLSTDKKWRINGMEIKMAECHAGLLQGS